jgi:hypothetical protein
MTRAFGFRMGTIRSWREPPVAAEPADQVDTVTAGAAVQVAIGELGLHRLIDVGVPTRLDLDHDAGDLAAALLVLNVSDDEEVRSVSLLHLDLAVHNDTAFAQALTEKSEGEVGEVVLVLREVTGGLFAFRLAQCADGFGDVFGSLLSRDGLSEVQRLAARHDIPEVVDARSLARAEPGLEVSERLCGHGEELVGIANEPGGGIL